MADAKIILKEKLKDIKLPEIEEEKIGEFIDGFLKMLNGHLKMHKARAVLGGSFSKGTTIRKKKYDVDIFAVFPRDAKGISELLEKAIKRTGFKASRIPGSRDYFSIKVEDDGGPFGFRMEIVPVAEVKDPEDALNVTDVSVLHVKYIQKKIKAKKGLGDEIRIAKAFCYAQDCYGAESHIKGFSGYGLEILTAYYGSFLALARAASKWGEKVVIDPEKHYKNSKEIMNELNEAKLLSPIIIIDPVQRNRNASAAMDVDQFNVFKKACKGFISNPSPKYFEKKEITEEEIISEAKKKKAQLFRAHAVCIKPKEDISGAKLLKLNNILKKALEKEGYSFRNHWIFREDSSDSYFLLLKSPKKVIVKGPPVNVEKAVAAFRKKWKKIYKSAGRFMAERAPEKPKAMLRPQKKMLEEMGIDSFELRELI